jgi:hypothetical protein
VQSESAQRAPCRADLERSQNTLTRSHRIAPWVERESPTLAWSMLDRAIYECCPEWRAWRKHQVASPRLAFFVPGVSHLDIARESLERDASQLGASNHALYESSECA